MPNGNKKLDKQTAQREKTPHTKTMSVGDALAASVMLVLTAFIVGGVLSDRGANQSSPPGQGKSKSAKQRREMREEISTKNKSISALEGQLRSQAAEISRLQAENQALRQDIQTMLRQQVRTKPGALNFSYNISV